MTLRHLNTLLLSGALALSASFISCKSTPSDADIQSDVTKKLDDAAGAGLTASVSKGVVTLTGTCKDEQCRQSCVSEVKEVKGVKDVVNNITVPAPEVTAPVEISPDAQLQDAVSNVVKDYKDVKAEVKDGVITLRGDIQRSKLQGLMIALNSLKPKKVDNQLNIK
jgi:hyperosmotically inducible protein